ncbi:MAG TPA: PPC domain-containing protein, partial [Gemmataceae bacterium]|nr:PPC domain-containing protein [Gemmataceae bacterium]
MRRYSLLLFLLAPSLAVANPPVASYIFPAGGQRGAKVNVRVGGLFLHDKCGFEMLGPGVSGSNHLTRTKTTWFEGPILPLPDSQRQEDYPKDMAGAIAIAADAPLGVRYWRLWTSQGATGSMKFIVGDLPEVVEEEIDGDPVPVSVKLPVTINGRIFPREDIDVYTFRAAKGQTIRCEVNATRLGSPLDARLEVRDGNGRRLTEASAPTGGDPAILFTAPADGEYFIRIHDANMQGGQAYVYRLTLSDQPTVTRFFPLGGRRGSTLDLQLSGLNVPATQRVTIPKDAPATYALPVKGGTLLLDVDDHPEFFAATDLGKEISLPAILNGNIARAGQVDEWKIAGKKGETWELELRAARLGSRLDGVLAVTDDAGKTLAKAEAAATDPVLRFQMPADGVYRVQLHDRYRTRGGSDFAYRLRIVPPRRESDFGLTLVGEPRQGNVGDAISLPRNGTAKLKLKVDRIAWAKEPIALEIKGLPAHVSVTPNTIQPNQATVDVTFKADDQAKIDVA